MSEAQTLRVLGAERRSLGESPLGLNRNHTSAPSGEVLSLPAGIHGDQSPNLPLGHLVL